MREALETNKKKKKKREKEFDWSHSNHKKNQIWCQQVRLKETNWIKVIFPFKYVKKTIDWELVNLDWDWFFYANHSWIDFVTAVSMFENIQYMNIFTSN